MDPAWYVIAALALANLIYRAYRDRLNKLEILSPNISVKLVNDDGMSKVIESIQNEFLRLTDVRFLYADKNEIDRLYNDYLSSDFKIEGVSTETTKETGGNIGLGDKTIPIEIKGNKKATSKITTTMKTFPISTNAMFLKYQQVIIGSNQVTFGLEIGGSTQSPEQIEFDGLINKLKNKFNLSIQPEQIAQKIKDLKEKAAEETLLRLEQASGIILIKEKFEVTENEKTYKFSYLHPISEQLPNENNENKVKIVFFLEKDLIENKNVINSVINQHMPLKVHGRVILPLSRKEKRLELHIEPTAVYY
jgi:hypothetical protein